jgi:hypothetical protein
MYNDISHEEKKNLGINMGMEKELFGMCVKYLQVRKEMEFAVMDENCEEVTRM